MKFYSTYLIFYLNFYSTYSTLNFYSTYSTYFSYLEVVLILEKEKALYLTFKNCHTFFPYLFFLTYMYACVSVYMCMLRGWPEGIWFLEAGVIDSCEQSDVGTGN